MKPQRRPSKNWDFIALHMLLIELTTTPKATFWLCFIPSA